MGFYLPIYHCALQRVFFFSFFCKIFLNYLKFSFILTISCINPLVVNLKTYYRFSHRIFPDFFRISIIIFLKLLYLEFFFTNWDFSIQVLFLMETVFDVIFILLSFPFDPYFSEEWGDIFFWYIRDYNACTKFVISLVIKRCHKTTKKVCIYIKVLTSWWFC